MAIGSILDSIAWADDEFSTSVIEGIVLLARDDRERGREGEVLIAFESGYQRSPIAGFARVR